MWLFGDQISDQSLAHGKMPAYMPAWASAMERRMQEEEQAREAAVSELRALFNEAVSALNKRFDIDMQSVQQTHAVHAKEAYEKLWPDLFERLEEVASRQEHYSHEHDLALRILTDHTAEALHGMNSEVQRCASSLDVFDRDIQHRIRCFEENQRQFQCCVAELRETQILLLQTDDAVAELRDKCAHVCSNLYQQPAMLPSSQQNNRARSPSPARSASPGSSRPLIRHLGAAQPIVTLTPRQLPPWSSHSGPGGHEHPTSMQRGRVGAPRVISTPKRATRVTPRVSVC